MESIAVVNDLILSTRHDGNFDQSTKKVENELFCDKMQDDGHSCIRHSGQVEGGEGHSSYEIVRCKVFAENMEKRKIEQMNMIQKIKKQIAKKRSALQDVVSKYLQSVYINTAIGENRQFDFMAKAYVDMPRDDPIEIEWRILCDTEKIMQETVAKMQWQIVSKLEVSRSLTKLLIERGDLVDDLVDDLDIKVQKVDDEETSGKSDYQHLRAFGGGFGAAAATPLGFGVFPAETAFGSPTEEDVGCHRRR
jgi:hypothetical protein